MNPWKRLGLLAVAVAAIVAAVMAFMAHNSTDPAAGTQSDPHVGTTKYPAPEHANSVAPKNALATITNPSAIPALTDVNAKCQWAPPSASNRPSLQDDGKGAQSFANMPGNPATATYKCAIARAKAAGYVVAGNSVKCDEDVIQLHDENANKLWSFRPFCMQVGQTGNPTCKVTLAITDYEGNFLWDQQPDLSRLQDFRADGIHNLSSYSYC